MATCQYTLDGKPTVETVAKRDDKGTLIGASDGVADDRTDASYSYAGNDLIAMDAGRESSQYTYNSNHQLVGLDERYKRDRTSATYKYNAAGGVSESHQAGEVTTYTYDAKHRPIR